MSIAFIKKPQPTDASTLGVISFYKSLVSDYAQFFFTFQGYNFLCRETGKVLTRCQIYWRNPKAARFMTYSLIVPAQYQLIEFVSLSNRLRHAS